MTNLAGMHREALDSLTSEIELWWGTLSIAIVRMEEISLRIPSVYRSWLCHADQGV